MINCVVTIPHVTDHLFRFSRSDVPFMRLLSSLRYTRYVRHRESINSSQKGIYARDSFTRNGSLATSRAGQHLTGISCSKERNHEDGQRRTLKFRKFRKKIFFKNRERKAPLFDSTCIFLISVEYSQRGEIYRVEISVLDGIQSVGFHTFATFVEPRISDSSSFAMFAQRRIVNAPRVSGFSLVIFFMFNFFRAIACI